MQGDEAGEAEAHAEVTTSWKGVMQRFGGSGGSMGLGDLLFRDDVFDILQLVIFLDEF